jgi:hypothetical protein
MAPRLPLCTSMPLPQALPTNQVDPEIHKLDAKGRPMRSEDPGRESDPLPHHAHKEAKRGDEISEPELDDDLYELEMDDLMNAEGPDA